MLYYGHSASISTIKSIERSLDYQAAIFAALRPVMCLREMGMSLREFVDCQLNYPGQGRCRPVHASSMASDGVVAVPGAETVQQNILESIKKTLYKFK